MDVCGWGPTHIASRQGDLFSDPPLWLSGWYIITYGLGIYALNLLIGFLSPASDPETEGPTLPTSKDDEFRPFVRRFVSVVGLLIYAWNGGQCTVSLLTLLGPRIRLPEFKFWYGLTKAFVIAFIMTFFSMCVPSWPPLGLVLTRLHVLAR